VTSRLRIYSGGLFARVAPVAGAIDRFMRSTAERRGEAVASGDESIAERCR
jgi:hypothetical protein